MIAQWMLSLAATAALLALAARALEEVLRVYGRATRWIWVAALLGSVLLPFAGWATGGAFPGGWLRAPASSVDLSTLMLQVDPALLMESASATEARATQLAIERALVAVWLVASLTVLGLYLVTWRRLSRSKRRWSAETVDGTRVLVSGRGGPAVVGLLRPAIVLPNWLVGGDEMVKRLVVLHEREHVRAGDHRLLALAPLVAAAMPWNPAIWWMLRRLRLAVELDCDRRVLASGIEPRTYGTLLLEIAGRSGRPLAGAAALVSPRTFLERRIMAMTRTTPRHRLPRAFALTSAAGVVALVACEAATPTNLNNLPAPDPDAAKAYAAEDRADVAGIVAEKEPPLVFVDGVIVTESTLDALDPNAIDRIEIIKGRAAESRYGPRGRDGVIQIFTKAGGEGEGRGERTELRLKELATREAAEVRRAREVTAARDAAAGTVELRRRAAPSESAERANLRTEATEVTESLRVKELRAVEAEPVRRVPTTDATVERVRASRLEEEAVWREREAATVKLRDRDFADTLLRDKDVVLFVDGVRITEESQLSGLEPRDIDSIEVLKGRAAAAIGISDGRSVISIFTKD